MRQAVREFLGVDRVDVRWLLALTLVAFVFRYWSPLLPDFIAHPFSGSPLGDCVQSTPRDTRGDLGTVCGLAYPFQKGYPTSGGAYAPPDGQVFDEIYFATFAHDDLKGIQYFDPEPPLSKLIIAGGEWGWGWFRATFQGAQGDFADLGYNPFGWRIMSCLFGTLCVPMMYLLARRLWPEARIFAVAAAILVSFDGMFFIQSRIGMIDIFPIFFILCSYWMYLTHLRSRTEREALATLVALGVILGLAVASKWIALAAFGSILFLFFVRLVRRTIPISVGTPGGWVWGQGEQHDGPVLPAGVRPEVYVPVALGAVVVIPALIYLFSWTPFFERGQFHTLQDLWTYNVEAYTYHANLTATHPYGSPWWTWPLLLRPVAYYFQGTGLGTDQWSGQPLVAGMVNLGNPWIWWSSLPCLLLLPYWAIRDKSLPATLILIGFLTQWLPWSRITRVIFLYHMFGGLPFMILALAFVLARFAQSGWFLGIGSGAGESIRLHARHLVAAHLAVAVACFLYFYPVWTALPISSNAYLGGFNWFVGGGKMWVQINCTQPAHPTPSSFIPCWI